MAVEVYADDPTVTGSSWSTLASGYTSGATTLAIASNAPYGAANPTAAPPTKFRFRIDNELFVCTDNRTTTWTVAGAQEGSTAAAHSSGATVTQLLSKGSYTELAATTVLNVTDFGAVGDGSTDDSAAIQAAVNAANTAFVATGTAHVVFLPRGKFKLSSAITWKEGASLQGSGMGASVLLPNGAVAAITGSSWPVNSYLQEVFFADFGIDGTNQPNTTYNVAYKGMFLSTCRRVTFRNLYIQNTHASGLGCDTLVQCTISNVRARNCGRVNSGTDPGGAGIGIGTGSAAIEEVTISDCFTWDNKRYGVLLESQTGTLPRGFRITNLWSKGNAVGVADTGCTGLVLTNSILHANTAAGFSLESGTVTNAKPGQDGVVSDCVISGTTAGPGVLVDNSVETSTGRYLFEGCHITGNASAGLRINPGSFGTTGIAVKGGKIDGNTGAGIDLLGTSAIVDLTVQAVDLFDNTTYGIALASGGSTTNAVITGNRFLRNTTAAVNFAGTFGGVIGDNPGWTVGTGSPETVVAAPVGTVYRRTDGGASTTFYVKETGTGNTGWVAYGAPGGGGGSLTVQDENSNVATGVTQIDFQGAGVTASAGTGEVIVTVSGTGSSLTVQDEGTGLTQRNTMNFVGAGVTATDDAGNSATVVTIPGGNAPLVWVEYGPSADTTYTISATSLTAIDTTNLRATFTAPSSGKVLVYLEGYCAAESRWGLLSGATTMAAAKAINVNVSGNARFSTWFRVTGLTAGTSYSFDWAGLKVTSNGSLFVGLTSGRGPLIMGVFGA